MRWVTRRPHRHGAADDCGKRVAPHAALNDWRRGSHLEWMGCTNEMLMHLGPTAKEGLLNLSWEQGQEWITAILSPTNRGSRRKSSDPTARQL